MTTIRTGERILANIADRISKPLNRYRYKRAVEDFMQPVVAELTKQWGVPVEARRAPLDRWLDFRNKKASAHISFLIPRQGISRLLGKARVAQFEASREAYASRMAYGAAYRGITIGDIKSTGDNYLTARGRYYPGVNQKQGISAPRCTAEMQKALVAEFAKYPPPARTTMSFWQRQTLVWRLGNA